MKNRGVFKISAMLAVIAASVKGLFASAPRSTGGSQAARGRDGFYAVSAPRTRAMKRRHPL